MDEPPVWENICKMIILKSMNLQKKYNNSDWNREMNAYFEADLVHPRTNLLE